MQKPKLFEVYMTGNPYSKAWDCTDCLDSFDGPVGIFQGGISGMYSKRELIALLRRLYPGCKIKNRDTGRMEYS